RPKWLITIVRNQRSRSAEIPDHDRRNTHFSFIRDWVEKKIRRHMGRARNHGGFGWKRWSRYWLYDEPGLFNGYRVRRTAALKARPAG
ncbi:hypothetical protein ACFFG5_12900, partial [Paraburkholderia humisilvae]